MATVRTAQLVAGWFVALTTLLWGAGCGSSPPERPPQWIEGADLPEHWDPTSRQAGSTIADAALARLGAPYRYGGTTGGGYDCSGLVYRIYLEHGIRLPRTVREQARVGREVRSLLPGDLLFFRLSGASASHVGVYVGDGGFVHASTGRRLVVLDDLRTNEFFRQRYVGARRILPLADAD